MQGKPTEVRPGTVGSSVDVSPPDPDGRRALPTDRGAFAQTQVPTVKGAVPVASSAALETAS